MGYKLKRIMMRPSGVEKQVRPDNGWKPGANTIAYYPLTSTTQGTDKSGNGFNLSNGGGVSFGTYQGVDCGYFSGQNCLKRSSGNIINNGQTTFTWLAWIYFNGSFVNAPRFFSNYNQANGYFILYNGSSKIVVYSASTSNGVSISTGGWHLYGISGNYGSGTFTGYKDTTSNSWTGSGKSYGSGLVVGGTNSSSDSFNGYMSEVIYENKIRTAQEVQDYYDQTKSKYGTSGSQASSCFLAGTPVLIEGGSKPIDELNIGDAVLSYNKSTGEKEYNKVVDIIEHTETKDLLYTLDIEGQRIEATEFHKFYISDNKEDWRWEEIRNLKEGQFVFSIGGAKKINSVDFKKFDGPCYNITVDNNHNYFVYDGILVHNSMSAS